jgi:hypothetical protein
MDKHPKAFAAISVASSDPISRNPGLGQNFRS